jgi:flavodoxin
MDVAIVYESLFGNTRTIAEAIAQGIKEADPAARVSLLPVGEAKADQIREAGLLIVGGPTHMRGMTSGMTRRKGLEAEENSTRGKGAPFTPERGAEGPGVRDWFQALPSTPSGTLAAAFDTRAGFKLAGGAAKGIARRLRGHGYKLAVPPAGFIITGTEGPLREGEPDRARAWGATLIRRTAPS